MTTNHKILDRMTILKGTLNQRHLSKSQSEAIEEIIDGYSLLISSSMAGLPLEKDIEVFSEIIKSSLIHTFKILKVYVNPREKQEGQGSTRELAGRS